MESTVVILALLALGLMLIEIFLIPGLGVAGIAGFICLLLSTYFAASSLGTAHAAAVFGGVSGITVLSFILFFRSPASKWLIHGDSLEARAHENDQVNVGSTGIAVTDLRPSGKARFTIKDREFFTDVTTNGEYISKGESVRVLKTENLNVIVEKFLE